MKKFSLLVLFLLVLVSASAQSKIKGNRNVTTEEQSLDYFSKLEVNDKIKLELKQGNSNSLELEADENLHDVLDVEVDDSTLTLSLNKRVTSSKRFNITLYVEDLDQMVLNDDSEVKMLEELDVFNIDIVLNNKSNLLLENLKTQFLRLETNERSKSDVRARTDSLVVHAKESSRSKLDIITEGSSINYSGNATLELEGRTTSLELNASDNAAFKGAEFVAESVLLYALDRSDSYVNAKKTITIEAKNKAKVYIFNKPEITLNTFEDNASLLKRESMTLLENL